MCLCRTAQWPFFSASSRSRPTPKEASPPYCQRYIKLMTRKRKHRPQQSQQETAGTGPTNPTIARASTNVPIVVGKEDEEIEEPIPPVMLESGWGHISMDAFISLATSSQNHQNRYMGVLFRDLPKPTSGLLAGEVLGFLGLPTQAQVGPLVAQFFGTF